MLFEKKFLYPSHAYEEHSLNGRFCTIEFWLRAAAYTAGILATIMSYVCIKYSLNIFLFIIPLVLTIILCRVVVMPSTFIPPTLYDEEVCEVRCSETEMLVIYNKSRLIFDIDRHTTDLKRYDSSSYFVITTKSEPVVYIPKEILSEEDCVLLDKLIPLQSWIYKFKTN